MSENTSKLKAVGERIRSGLGKMNSDARAKAEGKNAPHDELDTQDELTPPSGKGGDERLSARLDDADIEEGFIIDSEPEQAKPKRPAMGMKQKLLLIAACVVAALWFTKNQENAPTPADVAKNEQHLQGDKPLETAQESQIEGPAFNLNEPTSKENDSTAKASGVNENDALGFGGNGAKDAANEPIGTDALTSDMNEQFAASIDENNDVLDPFTGKVKSVANHPADLPAPAKTHAEPLAMLPPPVTAPHSQSAELDLIGGAGESPFKVGGSNSTELSGTKTQNPDSKASVLQDQSANADVTSLKAKIAEKDSRIGILETENSKLKHDLAAKQETAKPKNGPDKAASSKATQHKPVQAVHTTQRSTPSQRVASAPKAMPRPQICVTAVAPAARNCTTCVPHAFITHRGTETMVGQGDFLDGLRVNIVGDRLDLQNAQGDVVHKFWSSPNGCAAG
uniref:Uncharacterized protein n=1 Tax=Pseudomonas fluorescens (strain SBW25) TaxID=216595 RepID=A0A0G4E5B9_PSEFS|nr:hypothetical protein [Pseudomonas fluorescens]CEK42167.1 hypothetical protein PQBR57_0214 [Pseudomonas fluorescens SBW25]